MPEPVSFALISSPHRLKQFFLLSDPGFVRLRMASRAVLTTGVVCAVLALLHPWFPMPAAAYAIAMITAIQGTVAIKDTTIAARAVTRVYAALSGFTVIAGITLLDRSLLAVNALLLVVIFLAVYARRFGMRWQAVGMFTFMCGVIGAFLKPHDVDLKDIALSLCLSGFLAHFIRNFVLPERPDVDCRRSLKAATTLIGDLTGQIRRNAQSGWTELARKQAITLERRIRDFILLCESYLPVAPAARFANERAEFLAMRLFDLHLAMESALSKALSPAEIQSKTISPALQEKLDALAVATKAALAAMEATPTDALAASPGGSKEPVPLLPPGGKRLQDKFVRQALQVTLASAIAMAGGLVLSQERWFWAVLTAFLIFSNTQSRGDVAVRALNRTLGTAIGICIGIILATLVNGELYLTIVMVAVSIFSAFYLSSLSYSAMAFFVTVAISLVYGLTGEFSPGLLVLRLEETAVGVAAGIFVSLFVLPVGTLTQVGAALDHFMQTFDQLIKAVMDRNSTADRAGLMVASRNVDAADGDVRAAIVPLQSGWTFGMAQEGPRHVMMRVSTLAHAGHILVREFEDRAPDSDEEESLRSIRAQLAELAKGNRNMVGRSRIVDMAQIPEKRTNTGSNEAVDHALGMIEHVLRQADRRNQE